MFFVRSIETCSFNQSETVICDMKMDLSRYCATDYVNKRKPKVDRDGKFLMAGGLKINLKISLVLGRVLS